MALPLVDLHDSLKLRYTGGLFDDFWSYTDAQLWTKLAAEGTVAALSSGINGLLQLQTTNVDNNEVAVQTTTSPFKFQNGVAQICEARINFAEAATNNVCFAFGFGDVINSADFILDDGTGLAASWTGAIIYKLEEETTWRCATSITTTPVLFKSTSSSTSTSDQILRIECRPGQNNVMEVTFWLNNQPLLDSAQTRIPTPIKATFTYAAAVAMGVGAYLKQGGSSQETVKIDYIGAEQRRVAAAGAA